MPRTRNLTPRGKLRNFRLSPAEDEALEKTAHAAGVSVSAFIRAGFPTLLSEAGRRHKGRARHAEDNALPSCLLMLTRIHRNVEVLQQWTKTYRQGADAVSIMAHLVALEREIDRVRAVLDRSAPQGFDPAKGR